MAPQVESIKGDGPAFLFKPTKSLKTQARCSESDKAIPTSDTADLGADLGKKGKGEKRKRGKGKEKERVRL
jgi:hypothetical protein